MIPCNCKKPKNLDCPEQFKNAVENGFRMCIYNKKEDIEKKKSIKKNLNRVGKQNA